MTARNPFSRLGQSDPADRPDPTAPDSLGAPPLPGGAVPGAAARTPSGRPRQGTHPSGRSFRGRGGDALNAGLKVRADTQEKMLKALDLLLDGKPPREIAKAIGVSYERGLQLIDAVLVQRQQELEQGVERARTVSVARLDACVHALMPRARKGDIYAARTVSELEKRRAELLGLDAPQRVEQTVTHQLAAASDAELATRAAAYGIALGGFAVGVTLAQGQAVLSPAGGTPVSQGGGPEAPGAPAAVFPHPSALPPSSDGLSDSPPGPASPPSPEAGL